MPTFEVEFEIFCSCGHANLSEQTTVENGRGKGPTIIVEPCKKCLKRTKNEAWKMGYQEGLKQGEK